MPNDSTQTTQTETTLLAALTDIINRANSPDAWEAQNILLRRLALQGDVIGSRVPAPKNISEIGGYINLLTKLDESEMRSQTLAGILGVAGPNPPLGWSAEKAVCAMIQVVNDRPEGASQPMTPLTVPVRSDFVEGLQAAWKALHDRGCALPLLSSWLPLPSADSGAAAPADALPYLGRTLTLVPAAALADPATDALAVARHKGSSGAYQIAARALSAGSVPVAAADWEALKCDGSSCSSVDLPGACLEPIGPILAAAGFYPAGPFPVPATSKDMEWTRFNNVTGLVPGSTKLGDELAKLYTTSEVTASVFAGKTRWVWNGNKFVSP
jgi:hypothetical protein